MANIISLVGLGKTAANTTLNATQWALITVDGTSIGSQGTVDGQSYTVSGLGTFTNNTGSISFVASSSLTTDSTGFTFTNITSGTDGATATWNFVSLDLSNVTSAVKFAAANDTVTTLTLGSGADTIASADWDVLATVNTGAGNDTITSTTATLTSINAGDGDDTITLSTGATGVTAVTAGAGNDTVTVGAVLGANSAIHLGDGTDTLVLNTEQSAAVSVDGYTYGTDVIKGSSTGLTGQVTGPNATTGKATLNDGNTTVQTTADSNIYKLAVTNTTTSTTKDYWTAKVGTAVTMDASAITNATTMDASKATTAVITGGTHASIDLGTAKATVNVATTAGTQMITNYDSTRDTLNFVGGTAKDLKFDSSALTLTYGKNVLTGAAIANNGIKKFTATFDGGTAKTIVADNSASGTGIDGATTYSDADIFIGNTDMGSVLTSAKSVSLYDTDTYINLSKIAVDATAAAGATFVGNSDKTSNIDATNAANGVAIWGGSVYANNITMGSSTAADTLWFGSTDGADVITGFTGGFDSNADVVKLWNVSSLSNTTFANSGNANELTLKANGGSTATITEGSTAVGESNDHIKVMLSDGTIKKVAFDNDASLRTIDATGADVVIGTKANAATNKAVFSAQQTDALTASLWSTDVYQNIAKIDATAVGAAATLVGSATKQSTLSASAAHGSEIWGGSSDADTIELVASASGGTGTDVVWFGAADGKDSVSNFTVGTDVVKFWDASSVKEVFKNYTLGMGADTTFTSTKNTDSVLTLTSAATSGLATLKASDAAGDSIKAVVNGGGVSELAFATDAQIYDASGADSKVTVGVGITGSQTLFLDNGDFADNGSYYFGENITQIDGSASAASLTLIGRNNVASTLKGGLTSNAMWGGGQYNDTLVGNDSAVDTVWFGTGDGSDTFSTVDKGDVIHLYDVASANIANVTVTVASGNETVSLGTSKLTISDADNAALTGGLTFTTSDNVSYTYDSTSKSLVKKA